MDKSEESLAIGKRLREFRERLKIPRTNFALEIGYSGERIASYEAARAPLPYAVFVAIAGKFPIDPFWLATGAGRDGYEIKMKYPVNAELKVRENAIFYEVFNRHLFPLLAELPEIPKTDVILRYQLSNSTTQQVKQWFRLAPAGTVRQLADELQEFWKNFYTKFPTEDRKEKLQREVLLTKLEAYIQSRIIHGWADAQKYLIDKVALSANSGDVKHTLPNLLDRLKKATQEHGKKSELASFLGVELVSVSKWLSGTREPGGETTLKMLTWVEQQERQK